MHYERVRSDLQWAERTIIMALRSDIDSEIEREALEESFNLVQETAKGCRLTQTESVQRTFSQGISIE